MTYKYHGPSFSTHADSTFCLIARGQLWTALALVSSTMSLPYTVSPPHVTIGWQQTSYTTTEGSTTVVCAQVLPGLGTIGSRTFQVDYQAQNSQAVGECTASLLTTHCASLVPSLPRTAAKKAGAGNTGNEATTVQGSNNGNIQLD